MLQYKFYGWHLQSAVSIPGLMPWLGPKTDAEIEFTINHEVDYVPENRLSPFLSISGSSVVELLVPGVAKYYINANRIQISPLSNPKHRDVAAFLHGSAVPILCHLRAALPFRAAAVQLDGKVVVIMGLAGTGKSTVAAFFAKHGAVPLGDDLAVVELNDSGACTLRPFGSILKLWGNTVEALGLTQKSLVKNRPNQNKFYKFYDFLNPIDLQSREISRVFILNQDWVGKYPTIESFPSNKRREILHAHVHVNGLLELLGARANADRILSSIENSVSSQKLSMPFRFFDLPAPAALIEDILGL